MSARTAPKPVQRAVRLLVAMSVALAIVVGIPLAVAYVWPGLIVAALLWLLVIILYRRN